MYTAKVWLITGKNCAGGGSNRCIHIYDDIISLENLLEAWKEFLRGKRNKKDVQEFQLNLMDNIISLHNNLKNKTYTHGPYHAFNISDPKASVRDRLLHHAIYRVLYPYFDKKFIHDSYSCRLNKGTHKAMERFKHFSYKISKNNTKQCWILKCDIKKFFASIDHNILLQILKKHIGDKDVLWLLERIISSFHSNVSKGTLDTGLPLGNLTSQLLVNIYMNEFDQYIKHKLKIKYYIRYADDFVVLCQEKDYLREIWRYIAIFFYEKLNLELHPGKVFIKTLSSGIDFLGWVHFPHLKRLRENSSQETKASYLGMLKWGNTWNLKRALNEPSK
ncbi:MAG: group II intron reverse transcriptase domain-containing protein [Candidatus Zambryskibacteria bacterium]|nr:group II intron reverse transcriptase domain-containing protein [Candidatus Zambryskibacteria bacterium]